MKSLIKQLQDGEIAIKNDGSVEDLNRVLKAAFPKDTWLAKGDCLYYYAKCMGSPRWRTSNKTLLTPHSVSEFIKELDNMEKTRTITPKQAQSIIDSACLGWKDALSKKWAIKIVLNKTIYITEDKYKQMREACTKEQHILFDNIFGKDEEHYPDGTPCLVRAYKWNGWRLRYADGNGKFYCDGKKSGRVIDWEYHMKLDMNNLPVND